MAKRKEGDLRLLRDGRVFGPTDREELDRLLAAGRLTLADHVSVRNADWITIAEFLAAPAAPESPQAPAAAAPAASTSPARADDGDADSFQTSPAGSSSAPRAVADNPADESSVDVESESWSDGSTWSIDVPRDAALTYARGNGPFVAVGPTVYSLLNGEPAGRALSVPRFNALTSLSANGKYFAAADGTTLDVRDAKSGSTLESWQGMPSLSFIEFLEFADADHLITSARSGGEQRVQVWDISTGKPTKDVKIEGNLRGATLTADGRYLALVVTNYGIVIYDVLKGPMRGKGKISARIPITPLERRSIDVDGMRFASSGQELAALCDNGARLLCWDRTTHLVFEHDAVTSQRSSQADTGTYHVYDDHPLSRQRQSDRPVDYHDPCLGAGRSKSRAALGGLRRAGQKATVRRAADFHSQGQESRRPARRHPALNWF
ncbi:MAG: hypothetical protein ACREHD_10445 [Pirellulales bacterium]